MKAAAKKRAPLRFGKYRGTVVDNKDPQQQGRIRVRVPDVLGNVTSDWALPCAPYIGKRTGFYAIPSIGTSVFVEFEAGDTARPIWVGGLWNGGDVPVDERGTTATPDVKIMRSEQGLLIAFHDDQQTIAISTSTGANVLTIDARRNTITIKAAAKVVVEAPAIELGANATHPGVLGDRLLDYLNQFVATFNSHTHPVTSAPPVPPLPPPTPAVLSLKVKLH